jgi:hypothetical protein
LNRLRKQIRLCVLACLGLLALGVGLRGSRADSPTSASQAGLSRDRAFFPHNQPGHRKVDCAKCHTITPDKIDETRFPGHVSCVGCHNLALESLSRPVTYCGICHNSQLITKAQPALFMYPKPGGVRDFGMDFSHPAHLKPRTMTGAPVSGSSASAQSAMPGIANQQPDSHGQLSDGAWLQKASFAQNMSTNPSCLDCHKPAQQMGRKSIDFITNVGHPACFVCHGAKPIAPPSMFQCAGCHELAGPKYPMLYGRVVDFRHSDHVYDTRPIFKAQTIFPRAPDYLCSECHRSAAMAVRLSDIKLPQQSYCIECHNGKIGLPDPLAKNVLDSLNRP